MIKGIIDSDLPRRIEDADFRKRVEYSLALRDIPGTYLVYPAVALMEYTSQEEKVAETGLSLTLREFLDVTNIIRTYYDTDTIQADPKTARLIDDQYKQPGNKGRPINYKHERRYAAGLNNANFTAHFSWLDHLDEVMLNWARSLLGSPDDHLLDVRLRRCLLYAGLGSKVNARAPQH